MKLRNGLTLLELIVGITITGIILSAGYGMLTSLIDNNERAEKALSRTLASTIERREIIRWISGARLNSAEIFTFKGEDGLAEKHPDDAITFLSNTLEPITSSEGIVRLYIDRDSSTLHSGLVAAVTDAAEQSHIVVPIDSAVTGLEISYLSGVMGNLQWHGSWISTSVLPSAIRIVLTGEAGDTLHPALGIPILVPIGVVQ